jgi:hypothetical protein
MYRWHDLGGKNGAAVKKWAKDQMRQDAAVVTLAKAFTSYSWTHSVGISGLGDTVSKRTPRANVTSMDLILDIKEFRWRVEKVAAAKTLSPSDVEAMKTFLGAWRKQEKGEDR